MFSSCHTEKEMVGYNCEQFIEQVRMVDKRVPEQAELLYQVHRQESRRVGIGRNCHWDDYLLVGWRMEKGLPQIA